MNKIRHTPKGYIRVGIPRVAKYFRMSRSVPYQLKPFVAYPIRGRCTDAEKEGTESAHSLGQDTRIESNPDKDFKLPNKNKRNILDHNISATEISLLLHFRKKQYRRGGNWSSSLGAINM